MNHFYKYYLQSITMGRVTSRTDLDQLFRRSKPGLGLGRKHKVTSHYEMALNKHPLRRYFSSSSNKNEGNLDEFLKKVQTMDLKDIKENPEQVLNSFMREKFVSLSLINAQSLEEVEDILEKSDPDKLDIQEISLLIFYLSDFDGPLNNIEKIYDIITKGLQLMSYNPQEDSASNLLLSLGVLCVKKKMKLHDVQVEALVRNIDSVKLNEHNMVEVIKSLTYILDLNDRTEEYGKCLKKIMADGGEDILMSMKFTNNLSISEILFYMYRSDYTNHTLVSYLVNQLLSNNPDTDTAINTIISLNSLKYGHVDVYTQLFDVVMNDLGNVSGNFTVSLIDAVVSNGLKSISLTRLINNVHHNIKYLSIDGYVDMWKMLGIITHKKNEVNIQKTVEILKRNFGGHVWSMKDLELWDIISILSSLTIMKDQDVAFAHSFIKEIFDRKALDSCDGLQLFSIAKLVYAYSRVYEDAFIDTHEVCVRRMIIIPPEYRTALKDLFSLRKDLIKSSPFFNL